MHDESLGRVAARPGRSCNWCLWGGFTITAGTEPACTGVAQPAVEQVLQPGLAHRPSSGRSCHGPSMFQKCGTACLQGDVISSQLLCSQQQLAQPHERDDADDLQGHSGSSSESAWSAPAHCRTGRGVETNCIAPAQQAKLQTGCRPLLPQHQTPAGPQGLPCLLTSSHLYGHAAQVGKESHASMQRPAAGLDRPDGSQG